ncbi:MAG: bifunctional diguanylate cyclase/phosphodiesterase [Deltaproteobacteria bacterium]|nr:bifunctional diguanylate cyclase/phosphodiesterase [Deltaproteobacteria bacterium]
MQKPSKPMITRRKTAQEDLSLRDDLTRLTPALAASPATHNLGALGDRLPEARKPLEPARLPTENAELRLTGAGQQGGLDALTNLPNRAQFSHFLQQAMLTAQRRNKPLALLLIELDRFREINATFGHHWGEVLLQQVGARLRHALRKLDIVARLGGAEFALLLSSSTETAPVRVASRILHVLEQPFVLAGYTVDIGVSIGIALHSQPDEDAHALTRRAVVAAHMAERAGSGYAFYSAEHDRYNPDRLVLKADLRHALKHDQLILHYQPQVDLTTGHVVQAEALVRWQHPQLGLLFPDQFVPLAEQMGLIRPLSLWVLNTALRQCQLWQQEKIALHLSVNLSMWDLQDTHLPDLLTQILQSWNVPHDTLEIEIVETALAADPGRTVQILTRLREMGIRIAIDDFGAGYSSLRYLKQLPVHTIKIDKSFVSDMRGEDDAAIVCSTINLSHALGLKVVAEGVENQETYDMLMTMGCDLAQGNYLSYPLPALEFTRWLQTLPQSPGQRSVTRPLHVSKQHQSKERSKL